MSSTRQRFNGFNWVQYALTLSLSSTLIMWGLSLWSGSEEVGSALWSRHLYVFGCGLTMTCWLWRRTLRTPYSLSQSLSHKRFGLVAYLTGGLTRLTQMSVFHLSTLGAIEVSTHRTIQRIAPLPDKLHPLDELIYYLIPEQGDITMTELEFRLASTGALDGLDEQLIRRGLMIRGRARKSALSLFYYTPALYLISLIYIELHRYTPQRTANDLAVITFSMALILWGVYEAWVTRPRPRVPITSIAGESWLKKIQAHVKRLDKAHDHSMKERGRDELCVALALHGPKALKGTRFNTLGVALTTPKRERRAGSPSLAQDVIVEVENSLINTLIDDHLDLLS